MHGNVDDPLTIAGDQLMVCGPIRWEGDAPGDTPAQSVDVRSVTVVRFDPGSGQTGPQIGTFSRPTSFPTGTEDWMVKVRITGDEPLERGDSVRVTVQALVHLAQGGVRAEPWTHEASITDVPEDGGGAAAGDP
jgi:hypothetical protein